MDIWDALVSSILVIILTFMKGYNLLVTAESELQVYDSVRDVFAFLIIIRISLN